mmetsp:Transcript_13475/g.32157  ORF Transcript_13475/g.32157 Transcript_13475/m.32157 type:complete len:303 (+) Transcript_13475:14-922(+)
MAWPLLLLLMLGEARGRSAPTEPPPRREATFVRSAISGGAAAAAATVVFHPVDTMKTVLQQRGGGWRTLRALGLRELYTGVVPAAFSMMPACAVRMGAYEVLKATLLLQAAALSPGASITLASALSVVASSSVRAPLDMVKTQVQTGAAGSVGEALRIAWGRGGMAGLYRGAGLALLRDVPFFSINLLLYEKLKAAAVAKAAAAAAAEGAVPSDDVSGRDAIFIGAAAQGCAGLLTNPMDALKTQVQAGSAGGVRAAYGRLMARAGPIGFMRGAGARVIWIAPQGCVYYPVYEAVQKILTPK